MACGSAVMAESFSDASTQCAVLYNIGYNAAAGTAVRVTDASGREILSYTVPCDFSSVSLSSPAMKLGETCTVAVGDKEEEITLDTVSTTVGASGGGKGGFGGMGGHDRGQWDNSDGSERPDGMSGRGGWGGQPGNTDGAMPTPPDMGGEMPDFSAMPTPPDMGGARPDFGGEPPDMGGWARHGEQTEAMQNAAEEAAELQLEEQLPAGPQPVSASTWAIVGTCLAVLAFGILVAAKYRQ